LKSEDWARLDFGEREVLLLLLLAVLAVGQGDPRAELRDQACRHHRHCHRDQRRSN
jgi:hypothetical protein